MGAKVECEGVTDRLPRILHRVWAGRAVSERDRVIGATCRPRSNYRTVVPEEQKSGDRRPGAALCWGQIGAV